MEKKSRIAKNTSSRKFIVLDMLIGCAIALLIVLIQKCVHQFNPSFSIFTTQFDESICVDVIITQYTITFLIVSLLSLLSANGEYIYWIDILEQKIISPKHLNFISMSIYAFVSMFAGTVAFALNEVELVLIYFVVDVILLVFLTFRMTSIFFGKERLRYHLHKKITKEVNKYLEAPDIEKLHSIENKLNGAYENANKLAEKKEFGQILETDFLLLVDISELMKEKYDNDLAKVLYGNISKLLLVFQGNSDYIFNILNDRYQPFTNKTLLPHTVEMIQSALCSYFERILSNGEYRISQDYWISGIYQNLSKSYLNLLLQKNSTVIIGNEDYHNYEGEILFQQEKYEELNLIDLKFNLIHEKILVFSRLIYQNNPHLFFEIINKHSMPLDIMREIDFFGLICDNDKLNEALNACNKITEKLFIFKLNRYIDTYFDYAMTKQISHALGDREYARQFENEIKESSYDISSTYKNMLSRAVYKNESGPVTFTLLNIFDSCLRHIRDVINNHFYEKKQGTSAIPYPALFNKNTYETLVYKVQIYDPEFWNLLCSARDMYPENRELLALINKISLLFTQKNDLTKYPGRNYSPFNYKADDVRDEWVWGIDQACRNGEFPCG